MAELKTKPTNTKVTDFLNSIQDEQKRKDSYKLMDLMSEITGEQPVMWGSSIIGFGSYHYKYESGREGDTMIVGFSPRKTALTLYLYGIMYKMDDMPEIFNNLGKFKHGKGCLYIKKLEDINEHELKNLIHLAYTSLATNS